MPTDRIERNDQFRTEPKRYWRWGLGNPDPQGCQGLGMGCQRLCHRSIGDDHAGSTQDDNSIDFVEPVIEMMLHDDDRRSGIGDHVADRVAHDRRSDWIEHCGRFIEQDEPRSKRENPG